MIKWSKKWLFFCLSTLLSMSGCYYSFHSNQYQMIRSLVDRNESRDEIPDWALIWHDRNVPATAVSVDVETWFVSKESIVVRFDGWQITSVENLLPAGVQTVIELSNSTMRFLERGIEINRYECSDWKTNEENSSYTKYTQTCKSEENSMSFSNQIIVNGGTITQLKYKIHPNYPALTIRLTA